MSSCWVGLGCSAAAAGSLVILDGAYCPSFLLLLCVYVSTLEAALSRADRRRRLLVIHEVDLGTLPVRLHKVHHDTLPGSAGLAHLQPRFLHDSWPTQPTERIHSTDGDAGAQLRIQSRSPKIDQTRISSGLCCMNRRRPAHTLPPKGVVECNLGTAILRANSEEETSNSS